MFEARPKCPTAVYANWTSVGGITRECVLYFHTLFFYFGTRCHKIKRKYKKNNPNRNNKNNHAVVGPAPGIMKSITETVHVRKDSNKYSSENNYPQGPTGSVIDAICVTVSKRSVEKIWTIYKTWKTNFYIWKPFFKKCKIISTCMQ